MGLLRAAVVGTGMMGRHHVRILGGMTDVDLKYVVDFDTERAASLGEPWGAQAIASIDDLPEVDIAVVATPTETHRSLAGSLIERGVSVMVEKPLALNADEARELVGLAEKHGVTLAVGHVERFNPIMRFLGGMELDPKFIQIERMSPYTPRITSSIVSDLMVHDLDLACTLMGGATPVRIEAVAATVFSDTADVANAVLEWECGTIASIASSRITQDKVRRIVITEPERYIIGDCMRQDILIKRETVADFADDASALYRQANVTEIPYFDRSGEPLTLELLDFVEAHRTGRAPKVSGSDGLRAVELVDAVERAAGLK